MSLKDEFKDLFGKKDEKVTGWDVLILACVIHSFDAIIRLPGGRVDFYIWTVFFVSYAVLAVIAARRLGTWKGPFIASGLAAFVIPFIYTFVARNSIVMGMLMLLMPTWIIYLLVIRGERYPVPIIGPLLENIGIEIDLSLLYILFWIVFLSFSYMPQVQNYASAQGYELPTISPGIVLRYTATTFMKGAANAWQAVKTFPTTISTEWERTKKMVSGDYYTGTVDKSAEQRTGVYIENLRTAQAKFSAGIPVTLWATIKAATVAQPIDIHLSCTADPGNIAARIEPESDMTVIGSADKPVDCIFSSLKVGNYAVKLTAEFNFATRSYQKVYFMDEERLNEYRKRGTDPLEGFSDKKPTTQHSPGPMMIGMTESFTSQPVGITQGKSGPTIGVTLDNMWGGEVKQTKDVLIYTPKGLEVKDVNGLQVTAISCAYLREEEMASCDDNIENIYRIPPEELQKLTNVTIYTYRAHTQVTDSKRLLGDSPLSIRNVKVTVDYDYKYSLRTDINVEAVRP
jgi:uncharacterized membrane protein